MLLRQILCNCLLHEIARRNSFSRPAAPSITCLVLHSFQLQYYPWSRELDQNIIISYSLTFFFSCNWSLPGTGNEAAAYTLRFAAANLVNPIGRSLIFAILKHHTSACNFMIWLKTFIKQYIHIIILQNESLKILGSQVCLGWNGAPEQKGWQH